MIERNLWGSTTVRIWTDDLPDWETIPDGVMEITLTAPAVTGSRVRRAAMEYRSVPGHPSSYGALGVIFTPNTHGQFVVQISYIDHLGRIAEDSFAMSDEAHVGLYHEYVDGVLAGVRESEAIATLG